MHAKKHARNKGFTFVELMLVISIISLLASIILAALTQARSRGSDAARVETVNSISDSLELYNLSNSHYPIHTCVSSGTCGISIPALTSPSGDLSAYMPPVPASFNVGSAPNQATYISTDNNGDGYEILYPVENAGYAPNIGCSPVDVTNFGGSAGCIEMNATSSLWKGGSQSGGNYISQFEIVAQGQLAPVPDTLTGSGFATLMWSTGGGAASCTITSDATGIFSGYTGTNIGTGGQINASYSYPANSSGTITMTCYSNADLTGTTGSKSVYISVTN